MKKTLLVIPLIFVLFVSGCTVPNIFGPGTTEKVDDVIVIKSLEALPDSVSPGQPIKLVAYIQNVGSELVSNDIIVNLYDHCDKLFSNVETTICTKKSKTECTISSILPKEIKMIEWKLTPDSSLKLKTGCELKVSVTYPYETDGLSTISFIHPDELKAQLERGTFKTKTSQMAAGEGPIKAYITVEDQQPISSESDSTVLAFQIKNRGKGYLVNPDGSVIKKNEIQILEPKNLNISCIPDEGLRLIEKESAKIPCKTPLTEFNIKNKDDVEKELTKQISFHLNKYNYEFRDSVEVEIKPKI